MKDILSRKYAESVRLGDYSALGGQFWHNTKENSQGRINSQLPHLTEVPRGEGWVYDSSRRDPEFGASRSGSSEVSPQQSAAPYGGSTAEFSRNFSAPQSTKRNALHMMLESSLPILIFSGQMLDKADARRWSDSFVNTYRGSAATGKKVPSEGHFIFDPEHRIRVEYSNQVRGSLKLTGMWVQGVLLNYVLGSQEVKFKGNYYVGTSPWMEMGQLPSQAALLKSGIFLVGGYYNHRFISESAMRDPVLFSEAGPVSKLFEMKSKTHRKLFRRLSLKEGV